MNAITHSNKPLAVAKELKVGRFIVKIDGDGPVFAGLAGGISHGSSSGQMVGVADDPKWGNACPIARRWGRHRGVTTKLGGMWIISYGVLRHQQPLSCRHFLRLLAQFTRRKRRFLWRSVPLRGTLPTTFTWIETTARSGKSDT